MKVLTIKQPFATLIAEGYKEYEFRTWKTKYRGEFYIHAGMGVDREAMKRFEYLNLEYPQGVILARCDLVDCVLIDEDMKKMLKEKDPIVYYGAISKREEDKPDYGFCLSHVEKIEPIPAKGKLSFWEYKKD